VGGVQQMGLPGKTHDLSKIIVVCTDKCVWGGEAEMTRGSIFADVF